MIATSSLVHANPITLPAIFSERPLLKSIYAGSHQLQDFFRDDAVAVVFVFTSQTCPVAQQYVPTLNELHQRFSEHGVRLVAVYTNSRVGIASMAKHAHDADVHFPAMLDYEHRLAKLLDVTVTPEVVVLDAGLHKRYQGSIDDQFTKRGRKSAANEQYLESALTALVEGQPIEIDYVAPSGCQLETRPRLQPQRDRDVTYYRDVAPIIQAHCQTCHRPGNVAPFELMTYEDAYYSASTIAEVVEERRMPPWHAYLNPKFGKLQHDARLSQDEIDTLIAWADADAPEGDRDDAPPPVTWPTPDEWKIGKPDLVYKIPKPFPIPKTGILDYQFFRVRLDFQKDRWVQAVEMKPGNLSVVHHMAMHLVAASDKNYSTIAGMMELYGFDNEGVRMIGDYVPGDPYSAKTFAPGRALRLPANTDVIFEIHYTPNNREATTDQSMAGFRFAETPPAVELHSRVFRKPVGRFRIPPHAHHFQMQDSYYFSEDVEVDAIRAHFHLRGKSYRLELVQRDELSGEIRERETVFTIPAWDLDWQRTYELSQPLVVPAGSELVATGHFDNSRWNPNNPDPDSEVLWGQQTSDEMFNSRFIVRKKNAPSAASETPNTSLSQRN